MATAKRPKFTNDWEEQHKKVRLLNLGLMVIGALIVILVIIFVLRGHY